MSDNFCRKANKKRHATKKEAESAIFETRLRSLGNGGRAGQGRKARHCPHCQGFHVVMPDAAKGKGARS